MCASAEADNENVHELRFICADQANRIVDIRSINNCFFFGCSLRREWNDLYDHEVTVNLFQICILHARIRLKAAE